MSVVPNPGNGRVTVPDLLQRKASTPDSPNSKKIVCLTAYDYPTARLLDEAGVDVILDVTADVPHVFQAFAGVLDEADQALDRAALFLTQHLI